jgi:hypothetical protein
VEVVEEVQRQEHQTLLVEAVAVAVQEHIQKVCFKLLACLTLFMFQLGKVVQEV